MAFNPNDRVVVSNQSHQYRNKLGTVESSNNGQNQVRLDGFQVGNVHLFEDSDLRATDQPSIVTYP